MSKKNRVILTPLDTLDFARDGKLAFWKQILPRKTIHYRTKSGQVREINFDDEYENDLLDAYRTGGMDQTLLQLANSDNGHGHDMDPERQRAKVADMARWEDLPAEVQAKVGNNPGLYGKFEFFDKKAAKAVSANPEMGVSARIRENFTGTDGRFIKRQIIHVCGTIDPQITGLSPWQKVDMSYGDADSIIDLSHATYEGEQDMGKKSKGDIATLPTDDAIEQMTDEELAAFIAEHETEFEAVLDEADDDGPDDDEDDDENSDDDDETGEAGTESEDASLSTPVQQAIDLANRQASAALQVADQNARKFAQLQWDTYSKALIMRGVPADKIDLCESVLKRPDDMILDLSNADEDDLNLSEIVRELLEGYEGTIDMSIESGHGGGGDSGNAGDTDAQILSQWDI